MSRRLKFALFHVFKSNHSNKFPFVLFKFGVKMDLNVKIIEGVRQFPALHDNCGDLDERNHAWMQLADKLDMHVQVLQIRWHALLQLYHRDDNFKYSNRMQFIYRNKERPSKADNWPEFVITDEYLKGFSNEDQEQFIYLETEEETNTQTLTSSKENDSNRVETAGDKNLKNEGDDNSASDKVSKTDIQNREQSPSHDNGVKVNSQRKSNEANTSGNTNLKEKEESSADLNKINTPIEEANGKSSEKQSPLMGERCEDVIFGELVSAMLRRMDENKKKNIKKEIMNILFS